MADRAAQAIYQVECPHCGTTFEGELLAGNSGSGPRGFKCPKCRLFVPFERSNGEPVAPNED